MSSQRVSTITSYFAPNGEAKQPPKAARPISPPPTSRPSQQPEKAKGKRPTSGSPAPIPLKKQDTKGSNKISPKHLSHKDLPSNWASPNTASARKLTLSYQNGDIFDAPPNTLLIHACNTQGAWGGGIAIPFKSKYPKAYTIYNTFCTKEHLLKSRPVPTGTALLIPPADRQGHWIGCLFTSAKYGKGKDKPDVIVKNTAPAMQMLLELVKSADEQIGEVRMCRINSGKFGVPWKRTSDELERIVAAEGWKGAVEVWEPSDKTE